MRTVFKLVKIKDEKEYSVEVTRFKFSGIKEREIVFQKMPTIVGFTGSIEECEVFIRLSEEGVI